MARRVLVVEDDPALLDLMGEFLGELGCEILTAEDGAQALSRAAAERPDAITVDHRLPDIAGLDLMARLKADPATREIPLIFLSADAALHEVDARRLGARAVVGKPVPLEGLRAALEECWRPG